jgi:hypothetical protein
VVAYTLLLLPLYSTWARSITPCVSQLKGSPQGFDQYLVKPIDIEDLKRLLAESP